MTTEQPATDRQSDERKLRKELAIWALNVVESGLQIKRDELGATNASLAPHHDTGKEPAPMAANQPTTHKSKFAIVDCPLCNGYMAAASCWVQWTCPCGCLLSWADR